MKLNNRTPSDVMVVILCMITILMIVGAADTHTRRLAWRMQCGTNLSALGKAMLLYANDYDKEFPKSGVRRNEWVDRIPNWRAFTRWQAFGQRDNRQMGKTTTTSNLFLLVKYAEVPPKTFICPSDSNAQVFVYSETMGNASVHHLSDLWDFGEWIDANDNPSRHCSYAYHVPFGEYVLTKDSDPGLAVLADRNPWMDTARSDNALRGWEQFLPDSTADTNSVRLGNSDIHQAEGQNVLYLDLHVDFESNPTCGIDNDNIYTMSSAETDQGRRKGRKPKVYDYEDDQMISRKDSYLVQEFGKKEASQR